MLKHSGVLLLNFFDRLFAAISFVGVAHLGCRNTIHLFRKRKT